METRGGRMSVVLFAAVLFTGIRAETRGERSLTDASEQHRPTTHQSGGPPSMAPRAAPSRYDALENAADAGMSTPPLTVLLSVLLHGQRCPRSQPSATLPSRRLPRAPREISPRHVDAEERLWRCSGARPYSLTSPLLLCLKIPLVVLIGALVVGAAIACRRKKAYRDSGGGVPRPVATEAAEVPYQEFSPIR
eukprot:scaffold90949_cov60-Phaeocystis_antarctica.AAC.8